jgi:hypothetical protein
MRFKKIRSKLGHPTLRSIHQNNYLLDQTHFFQRNFKISIAEVKVITITNDHYTNVPYNVKPVKAGGSLSVYVSFNQNLPTKDLKVWVVILNALFSKF